MSDPRSIEHSLQAKYDFKEYLKRNDLILLPQSIDILQANITYMCNQACAHCHVQASPTRTEAMDRATVDQCIALLETHPTMSTLDLTGGAPELNPHFRHFVRSARALGTHVIVRHNLTVTIDGHPATGARLDGLPGFFAEEGVEVVSSLPYYQEFFTDRQRGTGVFDKSIQSMRLLNAAGYGMPESDLLLNLVYNPAGAFLPAGQDSLEADFKHRLESEYGVFFNNLYSFTNMPIFRFRDQLKRIGALDEYWKKLVDSFNPCAAEAVMCRKQISVSPDGGLYDCDFNQMLRLQITVDDEPITVFNFSEDKLMDREIRVAPHCFGCTAGAGSSCGGTTT